MALRENFEYASWKLVDLNEFKSRWPSFSPQEVACRGDGKVMLNFAALDALQKLRDKLGKPIILNSAYRSPSWNKKVGGAKSSNHMRAIAFDCQMTNHNPVEFEKAAKACGFRGFGHYPASNFMHVDTGNPRRWQGTGANARWFPGFAKTASLEVDTATEDLIATPQFNAPVQVGLMGSIKENAPIILPAVASPLAMLADGNGPIQWALGVGLLIAIVFGIYLFWKKNRGGEQENA